MAESIQISGNEDYGYKELYQSIDMVLMGGRTYRDIIGFDCEWPYKDKVSYIISRNEVNLTPAAEVHFITKNIIYNVERIEKTRRQGYLAGRWR